MVGICLDACLDQHHLTFCDGSMLVDVAILHATVAIFTAFVAVCLLLMSRPLWEQTGVMFWILASVLTASGHALDALNCWNPPSWLPGYVAVHLIFLGSVCHWWSVHTFFKRAPERTQVLATVALYFLAWVCLRALDLLAAASMLTWSVIALTNFWVLLSLIFVRNQLPLRTLSVLGLGFLLVVLVYFESALEDVFFPTHVTVGKVPPLSYVIAAMCLIMAQIAKGMGFLMLINDRLEQSLRLSAELDALTGLYNRRGFFRHAEILQTHARRMHKAVLMLDIDFFKRVNDQYGHQVGDAVLQEVARRARQVLREGDLIARYGGEEFIVLCLEAEPPIALAVAERMRAAVEASPIAVNADRIPLTISIGLSCWVDASLSLESQIALADSALYMAKGKGRNQVCLAGRE